jgi:hypothetical protein
MAAAVTDTQAPSQLTVRRRARLILASKMSRRSPDEPEDGPFKILCQTDEGTGTVTVGLCLAANGILLKGTERSFRARGEDALTEAADHRGLLEGMVRQWVAREEEDAGDHSISVGERTRDREAALDLAHALDSPSASCVPVRQTVSNRHLRARDAQDALRLAAVITHDLGFGGHRRERAYEACFWALHALALDSLGGAERSVEDLTHFLSESGYRQEILSRACLFGRPAWRDSMLSHEVEGRKTSVIDGVLKAVATPEALSVRRADSLQAAYEVAPVPLMLALFLFFYGMMLHP